MAARKIPWGKIVKLKQQRLSNVTIAGMVGCAATSVSYVIRNKHKLKGELSTTSCKDCDCRDFDGWCYAQEDAVPPESGICSKFKPMKSKTPS